MRFSQSAPPANMYLSLETFNAPHKDWLPYFGETDRPGELFYIFSISKKLTQIVVFLIWMPGYDSQFWSFRFIYII